MQMRENNFPEGPIFASKQTKAAKISQNVRPNRVKLIT
jgi:hypothetical protein